jgi:7-cyano-7-deazaguanine synthase in queuosine biosynthesis
MRRFRKTHDPKFGSGIRAKISITLLTSQRRNVDNVSVSLFTHVTENCLSAKKDSFEIYSDREIPVLFTDFRNWIMDGYACVINQDIDSSKLL